MNQPDETDARVTRRWWDFASWAQLLRAFGMAVNPAKLGLALGALVFSLVWGNVLDWIWIKAGAGVPQEPAAALVVPHLDRAAAEGDEQEMAGVFETWWARERSAMIACAAAVRHGNILGAFAAEPDDASLHIINRLAPGSGPDMLGRTIGLSGCIGLMVRAIAWLVVDHWLYAILFLGGSLIIWSWLCGAICRMHAVQYAVDLRVGASAALDYAQKRLFEGFVSAPLMPLVFMAIIGLILVIGGLLLSIPWFGDIVGGVLFGLAIVAGGVIALALLAFFVSGNLYWPAVAADGYDGPASVLHTVSYVQTRLARALWYLFVSVVLVSIAWIVVNWLVWLAMVCAETCVEIGALPGARLETVWGLGGPAAFFTAAHPETARNTVLWFLIGLWMYFFVGLIWAYMISLWLGLGTITYFLLRQSVDNIGLADVTLTDPEREVLEQISDNTPAPETEEVAPPTPEETAGDAPTESAADNSSPPPSQDPGGP